MDLKSVEQFYRELCASKSLSESLKRKLEGVNDEKQYEDFLRREVVPMLELKDTISMWTIYGSMKTPSCKF